MPTKRFQPIRKLPTTDDAVELEKRSAYGRLISHLVENPLLATDPQQLAKLVNRTPAWCINIMASDTFKAALERRRKSESELRVLTVDQRLRQAAINAIERLDEITVNRDEKASVAHTLAAAELILRYHQPLMEADHRSTPPPNHQTNVQVIVPPDALREAQRLAIARGDAIELETSDAQPQSASSQVLAPRYSSVEDGK